MLVPHFTENIFQSRMTLVSSNVVITITIDVKNHKKKKIIKNDVKGLSNAQ